MGNGRTISADLLGAGGKPSGGAEPSPKAGHTSSCDAAQDAAPRAAADLGLTDRYRYLTGQSGRRYLFSAIPAERLEDYRHAVVLMEAVRGRGRSPRAAWLGELDRDGQRRGPPLKTRDINNRIAWIHLLARTARDRRAVLDDLTRDTPKTMK